MENFKFLLLCQLLSIQVTPSNGIPRVALPGILLFRVSHGSVCCRESTTRNQRVEGPLSKTVRLQKLNISAWQFGQTRQSLAVSDVVWILVPQAYLPGLEESKLTAQIECRAPKHKSLS
ncbi:hypothetical protein RF11_15646 [Thelohanellus kitauei]|uniref:Uncharacterized protein n=1 Tax=Thelohanellus kitauei TaxID=669202 RepID=A0A0C2N387_THEKT|nr:hypothetical protein RF11_15646 [Thelohanellus kitauei]